MSLIARIKEYIADPAHIIDMAHVDPPQIRNAPVSPEMLEKAEAELGFRLPEFLRHLYLQVANGGFGPGYGLLALYDKPTLYGHDLVNLYLEIVVRNPPPPPYHPFPKQFMFIADWGCNINTMLNWQDGSVHRFNGDFHLDENPYESVMRPEAPSLETWFEDWLTRPGRERFEAYR